NAVVAGINKLIEGITAAIGLAADLAQGIADLWNSAAGGKITAPTVAGNNGQMLYPVGQAPGVDGARASGGPVWKGGSFLVGENEPEVFTPNESGTITPLSRVGTGPISIGPFHFKGVSGDPVELERAVRRATEDA